MLIHARNYLRQLGKDTVILLIATLLFGRIAALVFLGFILLRTLHLLIIDPIGKARRMIEKDQQNLT